MNAEEALEKAMDEAGKVFGVDPAYFGKEGEQEVERQLNKLGWTIEDIREYYKNV